jgi:hypothetical protein
MLSSASKGLHSAAVSWCTHASMSPDVTRRARVGQLAYRACAARVIAGC